MVERSWTEGNEIESCTEVCTPQAPGTTKDWPPGWRDKPAIRTARKPERVGKRMGQLVTTIEDEVIPRMLLSQRASAYTDMVGPAVSLSEAGQECVEEFAALLLTHDIEVAYAYIDSIRVRGVPLSSIYLELLAPAARRLGRLWEEDRCAFAEVTVALCRLHEILRGLSLGQEVGTDAPPLGRRVLLVPVPGEQHTFGLLMVADFFRRAGWEVWSESLHSSADLLGLLRHEWFTLIGLSVGCETRLGGLASLIHSLRKAARNRSLGVMVGGSLFTKQPELAVQLGADATGKDGRQAALQAENLVSMLASRC